MSLVLPSPPVSPTHTVAQTVAPSSPSTTAPSQTSDNGATAIQVWTLVVAGLAVLATLVSAYLLRRTGKGQVEAAKQAAAASERSAEAADKSAQAAQEAVGVNRETAAGVAVRAEADARAKRYQDAATLLGADNAAARMAGVYAMARLADEARRATSVCKRALAYARLPPRRTIDGVDHEDQQVRSAIQSVLAAHLQADSPISWSMLHVDLRRAELLDSDFTGAIFSQRPHFTDAVFRGLCLFDNAMFMVGANFDGVTIEPEAILRLEFITTNKRLCIRECRVQNGGRLIISPATMSAHTRVELGGSGVAGNVLVLLQPMTDEDVGFDMTGIEVEPGGAIRITSPPDAGTPSNALPRVSMGAVTVRSQGEIDIDQFLIDHDVVKWRPANVAMDAELSWYQRER